MAKKKRAMTGEETVEDVEELVLTVMDEFKYGYDLAREIVSDAITIVSTTAEINKEKRITRKALGDAVIRLINSGMYDQK